MKIHLAAPIKIQAAANKPLPNINKYPLNLEAKTGIQTIIEELLAKGLIVPYNTRNILLQNLMEGDGYLFVSQVVNNIVIPWHPVAPDPHTLRSKIPPNTCFFSTLDLCSVSFSILVGSQSQFQFAFTWKIR